MGIGKNNSGNRLVVSNDSEIGVGTLSGVSKELPAVLVGLFPHLLFRGESQAETYAAVPIVRRAVVPVS